MRTGSIILVVFVLAGCLTVTAGAQETVASSSLLPPWDAAEVPACEHSAGATCDGAADVGGMIDLAVNVPPAEHGVRQGREHANATARLDFTYALVTPASRLDFHFYGSGTAAASAAGSTGSAEARISGGVPMPPGACGAAFFGSYTSAWSVDLTESDSHTITADQEPVAFVSLEACEGQAIEPQTLHGSFDAHVWAGAGPRCYVRSLSGFECLAGAPEDLGNGEASAEIHGTLDRTRSWSHQPIDVAPSGLRSHTRIRWLDRAPLPRAAFPTADRDGMSRISCVPSGDVPYYPA